VQSEIASQVASRLDVALTDSVKTRLEARPTQNVAAYDAYLRARDGGNDPASLRASIAALEQAVALDPSFARAWAKLADRYSLLYSNGIPTRELAQAARRAVDRAIALAPGDASGFLAMTTYFRTIAAEPDSARAALETAVRLAPTDPDALAAKAHTEMTAGAWDSALVHIDAALARDPRAVARWTTKAELLSRLHRYAEARAAGDHGLQLQPADLRTTQMRTFAELMAGDLPAAQAVLRRSTANPVDVAAYMSAYNDLYWVLPAADQNVVLRLGPAAFGDDRAGWAAVRTEIYWMRGDTARARIYADSALAEFDQQLREVPDDPQRHVFRGLMLAYLGRKAEAIAEGERGTALLPLSRNADFGGYLEHQLARIYILTGEQEKAIDTIERLMQQGYLLSPGYLRIDPGFAPLRGNPRFQKLTAGA
jgi:tetratricopeptide (TPR) repeat protein